MGRGTDEGLYRDGVGESGAARGEIGGGGSPSALIVCSRQSWLTLKPQWRHMHNIEANVQLTASQDTN